MSDDTKQCVFCSKPIGEHVTYTHTGGRIIFCDKAPRFPEITCFNMESFERLSWQERPDGTRHLITRDSL